MGGARIGAQRDPHGTVAAGFLDARRGIMIAVRFARPHERELAARLLFHRLPPQEQHDQVAELLESAARGTLSVDGFLLAEQDGQVVPSPKDKDGGETKGKNNSETKGKGDGKEENPKATPKRAPAVLPGRIALEVPAKPAEAAASSH